jgi:hypothetical protein
MQASSPNIASRAMRASGVSPACPVSHRLSSTILRACASAAS